LALVLLAPALGPVDFFVTMLNPSAERASFDACCFVAAAPCVTIGGGVAVLELDEEEPSSSEALESGDSALLPDWKLSSSDMLLVKLAF